MDAAASSIERDGIGCTTKLEQTLFDDMNGLCRGSSSAFARGKEAGEPCDEGRLAEAVYELVAELRILHLFLLSFLKFSPAQPKLFGWKTKSIFKDQRRNYINMKSKN